MFDKIKAWWNALPHGVQAVVVLFGGGVIGVLEPVVEHWAQGQVVCTVAIGPCVVGYLVSAAKAGVLAVLGLYLPSSFHRQ